MTHPAGDGRGSDRPARESTIGIDPPSHSVSPIGTALAVKVQEYPIF